MYKNFLYSYLNISMLLLFAHLINKVTKMYKFRIYLYYRVFWYVLLNNKIKTMFVCASVLFCAEVVQVFSVLCSVFVCVRSVFVCAAYCVQIVCVLCADCVHLYCWGAAYMCILYSMQVHDCCAWYADICMCDCVCMCAYVCVVFGWGLSNSIRYPPIWLPMRV